MIKVNSIKFKISVFYTTILGMILLIYTGILYFGLRYALYRDMDHDLVVKAQEISNVLNSYLDALGYNERAFNFAAQRAVRYGGEYPNREKIAELDKAWLLTREKLDLRRDFITLVSPNRHVVANSPNMDPELILNFLKNTSGAFEKAIIYRNIDFNNNKYRIVNIPYHYQHKKIYIIQVGVSRTPIRKVLYGSLFVTLVSIPLVLILASFMGAVIAERILNPVMAVSRLARNITHKDLSVRVKAEHVDEELRYLVDAFNEMIARLDKSFKYIAEFSSNVAHELKTPLTIMRGESEVTLMKERTPEEYVKSTTVTLEETERLLRIVEDLLLLSKLEYQPEVFKFEAIDFPAFMRDLFEQARKLAAFKKITVSLTNIEKGPKHINADKLHLRRLFLNLLNNAVKFTPSGGSIKIHVQKEGPLAVISITDTGMGIEPKDIGKIFDRFFHVHLGGQPGEGGSGLGLSIAQSIVKIHHGEITVKSQPKTGSTFTVTLPLRD